MNFTTKTAINALDDERKRYALTFWERTYDTAVAHGLHRARETSVAPDEAAHAVAETAAMIADKALGHWLDRWKE